MFSMTSCMDTYYVTHKTTFDNTMSSIQAQLADQGFYLYGSSTDTRNNPVVTDVSFSKFGYGTAMENVFVTKDTYRFADSVGNTMNFSVSYQVKQTREDIPYVENVELCGCETSNIKEYERMCGQESIVKQVNSIPKDQMLKILDNEKTLFAATGLLFGLIVLLIINAN